MDLNDDAVSADSSFVAALADAVTKIVPKVEYQVIRLVLAFVVIWFFSSVSSKRRLYAGVLSAIFSGFLVYTFLEPLFVPVNSDTAMVFLYILTLNGSAVGMSLGVLMPSLFPGACFGGCVGLLGIVLSGTLNVYMSPIVCGVAAAVFAALSARYDSAVMISLATSVEGGVVASCTVLKSMLPFIVDIVRGYVAFPTDDEEVGTVNNIEHHVFYGILWIVSSLLVAASIAYRDGHFENFNIVGMFKSSASLRPEPAPSANNNNKQPTLSAVHQNPPMRNDVYNMFDPADLPPRLAEYANMVYSACEDLGNFFGFQDSSVRNQAEHLLILLSNNRRYMSSHILPPSVQPPSPIHALHAKVFSNYIKWCRAMAVHPHFSKMNTSMNAPPAVASRVVDLVLYFCIWGEAANLRHMSECIWFLYHRMMQEYVRSEGYTQTRSLYAGHFLDYVVAPIYSVVNKSLKSKADHELKCNYDDFNEFFWSRNCLRYRYSSENASALDVEGALTGSGHIERLQPIADGLASAPKTFLEKRSWLRGVLALSRIVEWHIVTFYVLGVIAFARELVWGWVYSLQVSSAVFWIFNCLHLTWALLEVWASFPGIHLSGTDVCGSMFVLIARFLTLVYQTLYLMWAFSPQKGNYLGVEADSTFWWWQYIWLSLLVMIPYFFEAFLQVVPSLATKLYTSQNEIVQSFLNILYPLSRLYVGKEVHESFSHSVVYLLFWVSLMAWKLFFSYVFEVYSMVLPSLQLTDDYLNYPNQSFAKMSLLLCMRWLPQFIVYIIDMSIWYAAWQAFAGTSVGLSEHLGDVRSLDDIRRNFGQAPEHFCRKMLSPDAGSRRGSSASFLGSSASLTENTSLLAADSHKLQSYNRLLDVRIQKWVMFSAAWNEIIDHFRTEDIISNLESDNLKFSQFDGFSQAIYLPVFQTAGVIDDVLAELERPEEEYKDARTGVRSGEKLLKPISDDITMQTAVAELWELGSFIFQQILGSKHSKDIQAISETVNEWAESGEMPSHVNLQNVRSAMKPLKDFIGILHGRLPRRKPNKKPLVKQHKPKRVLDSKTSSSSTGMRKVVSAGSLSSLDTADKIPRLIPPKPLNTGAASAELIDALRDQVRDKLRSVTHAFKSLLIGTSIDKKALDVLDRLTFMASVEDGFFWDDAYASNQLDSACRNETFKAVLKKIHGLVCMHPDDAEPKSKEARRRLTFFVNTLFMDMPDAPSIHDMFSWNVLTPFYKEDVTCSRSFLEKRSDTLGVSTLLYLQTLYRSDWNNFLERLGIQDEDKIFSKKYIAETRKWASIRSQTLSRTVNGLMYCEKALRLLANLERLDGETTDDLMGEKFGYVVSCQVYGSMKREQDSKADDIDELMHRFPHLRVAYIDSVRVNRDGDSVFFSCLVKSDGLGNIQEVYRVRLPGNPVIGEGKPENQNHAMIFTRGEFVQTIDMNQEGYFEEALKMRNCLQEFAKREGPLPTTILGLREHIFTGSVSSLANYMALQEHSFVTLGQRVLTRPLRIRLHYGHPDVFDKLFFITRGGVSKASKGINLSEDIFAGYNNIIRGGSVGFKEYVQVGKGRDVGMSQIYQFEAKLSQGAAEQSLSRDVYRMCNRLDFCRLLSYYYGGIGHYFSNVLTIFTVYVVVYLMTVLAIFDLEKIGDRLITPMGTIQMMLGGLGLLQTIPLFATLGVERGWVASLQEIFLVFITGGPLHFMFHIQTKANYMSQTILVGGAKYRPTGRGFVTQHTPFDEQFRNFASSHLYLGVELAAGLILMGVYTHAKQYFGRTWSLWLAAASFLCSPFWFNPLTFDWSVVTNDYDLWLKWMNGSSGGSSKSWSMWYNEENAFYKGMPIASKLLYVLKCAVYLLIAKGIANSNLFRADITLNEPAIGVNTILISIGTLLVIGRIFSVRERTMPYPVRRTIGIMLFVGVITALTALILEDINYVRYALAAYYAVGAFSLLGLLFGVKAVKHCYLIHDIVCGHIIFVPLFLLAALQLPGLIQTWLLYHNALSSDVVVSDILRYARRTQESGAVAEADEDLLEQIADLRRIVQKQERVLQEAGFSSANQSLTASLSSGSMTDLFTSSGSPSVPVVQQPTTDASSTVGRAVSMSGLDLWSTMAVGDVPAADVRNQGPTPPGPTTSAPGSSKSDDFSFMQPTAMPPR